VIGESSSGAEKAELWLASCGFRVSAKAG
jgi:hypothetical protein